MEKKVKRIRACAVCRHEAREGIERAVIRGEPVRMIAGRFTVSVSSVQRHKKNHLAGEMAAVLKEQSSQRMSWLMEEWHLLRSETVALDAELREQKKPEARLKVLAFRSHLIDQGRKLEETLPRMPEWKQTAEYQEARAKMIRLMSDDPAAYRKFVEVLEKLEDQEKAA
ncbi:MAG: hypothetical protein ACKV22_32780 [Bryobacteraceae bacterium]